VIGVVLRVVSTHSKRNIFFVRPQAHEGDSASEEGVWRVKERPETIRIRTQNVGFIPLVSPFNGLTTPTERSALLLESLARGVSASNGPVDDIVCLQEQFHVGVDEMIVEQFHCGEGKWVWQECEKKTDRKRSKNEKKQRKRKEKVKIDEKDRRKKEEKMAKRREEKKEEALNDGWYGWYLGDCVPSHLCLNSGVAILSRYPLADPEFTEFNNRTADNKMAAKGVLGCTGTLYFC